MICDLRESLLLRARLAAEDADGAYDEDTCAKIERLSGRVFGPRPASGNLAAVMS